MHWPGIGTWNLRLYPLTPLLIGLPKYITATVEFVDMKLSYFDSRWHSHTLCARTLRRERTPMQAYWNGMSLDEISLEINTLSYVEIHLLSKTIPFVKMVKLSGCSGQHRGHSQAVLFSQNVKEIDILSATTYFYTF